MEKWKSTLDSIYLLDNNLSSRATQFALPISNLDSLTHLIGSVGVVWWARAGFASASSSNANEQR